MSESLFSVGGKVLFKVGSRVFFFTLYIDFYVIELGDLTCQVDHGMVFLFHKLYEDPFQV